MANNTSDILILIEKGYKLFAQKEFIQAISAFFRAIEILCCVTLEASNENTTPDCQVDVSVMCTLHLNTATCMTQMQCWEQARCACINALDIEPTNVKAVYRLAESLIALRRTEEAKPWVVCLEQSPLASDLPLVAEFREALNTACSAKKERKGKEKKSTEYPAVALTPALWIPGELLEDAIKVSKKNAAKLLAEEKAEKEKKKKEKQERKVRKK